MGEQLERYEGKLAKLNESNQEKMCEMEREIKLQRDRTVAILVDKEKEIKLLQAKLGINPSNHPSSSSSSTGCDDSSFSHLRSSGSTDNTEETLNNMLQKVSG